MGAAPLNWLAKIGGDTLKTKAKLLSSAINELYDNGFKKKDIVGLDYIKAATAADLKNKVPEANAVKELNSNLKWKILNSTGTTGNTVIDISGISYSELYVLSRIPMIDGYSHFSYINLLKQTIGTDYRVFTNGGYISEKYNEFVQWLVKQDALYLNSYNLNGTGYISSATTWVYYK